MGPVTGLRRTRLQEVEADMTGEHPKPVDPARVRDVDVVVAVNR